MIANTTGEREATEASMAVKTCHALVEAWNAHDTAKIAAIYSADCTGTDVAMATPVIGRDGVRRRVESYLRAFPDIRFTIQDLIVESGRTVVVWQARGTQDGMVMNIPPTRRNVVVSGVWVLSLREGQIERSTCVWDVAGMLRGLGLLPEL